MTDETWQKYVEEIEPGHYIFSLHIPRGDRKPTSLMVHPAVYELFIRLANDNMRSISAELTRALIYWLAHEGAPPGLRTIIHNHTVRHLGIPPTPEDNYIFPIRDDDEDDKVPYVDRPMAVHIDTFEQE